MGQQKRRNEALDCFVYALAALRISISRWQLDLSALLASLQEEDGAATNKKTLADYARALSERRMNDATGRTCRCPCGTA